MLAVLVIHASHEDPFATPEVFAPSSIVASGFTAFFHIDIGQHLKFVVSTFTLPHNSSIPLAKPNHSDSSHSTNTHL